jgi:hypothetical protein
LRFSVLAVIGICRFLNDTLQSLSATIYWRLMDNTSLPKIERRPGS